MENELKLQFPNKNLLRSWRVSRAFCKKKNLPKVCELRLKNWLGPNRIALRPNGVVIWDGLEEKRCNPPLNKPPLLWTLVNSVVSSKATLAFT